MSDLSRSLIDEAAEQRAAEMETWLDEHRGVTWDVDSYHRGVHRAVVAAVLETLATEWAPRDLRDQLSRLATEAKEGE